MGRHLAAAVRVGAVAALLIGWGCGPSAREGVRGGREAAREAEWRWLSESKRALDAERDRLAGQQTVPATAAGQRAAAQLQVEAAAEELNRRLVDFINTDPPVPGEPLSPRQRDAIRMKSDEDVRVAREYIERGGDYRRALEILRSALVVDPGNRRLHQEIARAQAARYMTGARFAQVKEGMTAGEVSALLGAPNPKDVRAYPDKGVVAWFYPKGPAGSAAAVWFERRADGAHAVYKVDFDAVRAPAPGGEPEPAARTAA
jgi:hypothetical protein